MPEEATLPKLYNAIVSYKKQNIALERRIKALEDFQAGMIKGMIERLKERGRDDLIGFWEKLDI